MFLKSIVRAVFVLHYAQASVCSIMTFIVSDKFYNGGGKHMLLHSANVNEIK